MGVYTQISAPLEVKMHLDFMIENINIDGSWKHYLIHKNVLKYNLQVLNLEIYKLGRERKPIFAVISKAYKLRVYL